MLTLIPFLHRWLRRLLFSGTNSFNSMVTLTIKNNNAKKKGAAS